MHVELLIHIVTRVYIWRQNMSLKRGQKTILFSKNRPLGRFFHIVAMSVYLSVCLFVPFSCYFFEASHWPSDPMISSRPLIGQPSLTTKLSQGFIFPYCPVDKAIRVHIDLVENSAVSVLGNTHGQTILEALGSILSFLVIENVLYCTSYVIPCYISRNQ